METLIASNSEADLLAAAGDPRLTEDLALALLVRRDLAASVLEAIASSGHAMKHRRVQMAVAAHPRTPRFVSLPMVRRLYTFELLKLSLMPAVASDLKIVTEETIVARLEGVSAGERLSLAKQATTRVASALLADTEARVMQAALASARMTEAAVTKAIMREDAPAQLVHAVCAHPKWSLCRDVQLALLRSEFTPLAKAIQFAQALPLREMRDVLSHSRLPRNVKDYVERLLDR
ncbi:MAG TPA: hypothetical protein VN622_06500 [Clostridia bacterium]|nr:hypothetical protein [Clostridia bacterium]